MRVELPRYPTYQPTESAWLGEMPEGWEAIQLARLNTKLTNGFVGPTRDILRDEGVRYLQSLHIKGGRIVFDTPYFVSEEWSAAHKKANLKFGDVLIVQTGDIGQVAAVTDEFVGCSCHALIIVRSKPKMIDGYFLSAVLRSHYGFHSLKSVQTGALHPHLNCTNIRDIYLPVPPLPDQRAILAFLDRETAKIDRLMAVRQKQVECLQEQRTAVIHHAVTKGLDPQAKMKPSGVEWLGGMPSHWESWKVSRAFRQIGSGTRLSP
ncbi:MAG: restriction endonuclease subunit S [Candidatus Dechloromonas phosphoritropha]|jgi:type I restriction enzyme S subunit